MREVLTFSGILDELEKRLENKVTQRMTPIVEAMNELKGVMKDVLCELEKANEHLDRINRNIEKQGKQQKPK